MLATYKFRGEFYRKEVARDSPSLRVNVGTALESHKNKAEQVVQMEEENDPGTVAMHSHLIEV